MIKGGLLYAQEEVWRLYLHLLCAQSQSEPLKSPYQLAWLYSHCYSIKSNPKKMGPLHFCLIVFLVIHRNSKQKDFFNLSEGFLRKSHFIIHEYLRGQKGGRGCGGGGRVFVGGAVGIEVFSAYEADLRGSETIMYSVLYTLEELCEMVGIALFCYALMRYIETEYGYLRIHFDSAER